MDGLAEAAQVLSSPDAGQDDRAAAQELFEQLKTEAEPLEAFASVLEHAADPSSHDELLLFHGATVLKVAFPFGPSDYRLVSNTHVVSLALLRVAPLT